MLLYKKISDGESIKGFLSCNNPNARIFKTRVGELPLLADAEIMITAMKK
jgi:hypothetical protein